MTYAKSDLIVVLSPGMINNINERSELLTSLDFVDYVIIFSDDTPHNILSILKPNILVKGGDYTKKNIIGKSLGKLYLILLF